ncbi:MAG: dihydropteroate synthase [Cyclobacteriaceae bacterium]|nr:dihydropteroate synthase [Cyclobacteriaceae bacterium]
MRLKIGKFDRKSNQLKQPQTINTYGRLLDFDRPRVMGILNITPDSFFGASRMKDLDATLQKAATMLDEGATFLDVGGYSSRPGAADVGIEEELKRVLEPIRQLHQAFPAAVISIDTFRRQVAEKALEAGAAMINDISAGQLDTSMLDMVADTKVPYIAMHMRGTPQTMQDMTHYDNMIGEIARYFGEIHEKLSLRGACDLIMDPGFGFAKDRDQNFYLLGKMGLLKEMVELPLLAGVSRKSMIFKTLGISADDSLNGTTVLNTLALQQGADILRVHDVKPAIEAVQLIQKLREQA